MSLSNRSFPPRIRSTTWLTVTLLAILAGCDDTGVLLVATPTTTEVGLVVGSVDLSLTIFPVDTPSVTRVVGLGFDGSPVSLAARAGRVAVPMGIVPAVSIVDISTATVLHVIGLPAGSGATGIAFVNDSVAVVANPGLDTVSPVNVVTGVVAAEIPVSVFPQSVLLVDDQVFVLNGELENFAPARPGTITVLHAASMNEAGSISLSGQNPSFALVGSDGLVYVINSGAFFGNNGSLSVVDPVSLTELEHHDGFGDFPGMAAFGPDGNLYVSSFQYGIAIWDPRDGIWVRGPDQALAPDDLPSASGVAFDSAGRMYTLSPDCANPSFAHRLDNEFAVAERIDVGICPLGVGFTSVTVQ